MMPSTSGSLDSGSIDVEAVDSIDGPRLRSTAAAGARSTAGGRPGGDRRVRDDARAADRDLLAAERDVSEERLRRLTAEVAALEAEVETLEAEVESKERQRQQVIDNYESIVAARRSPANSSGTDAVASETSNGRGLLAAVASGVGRVAAWLRPGHE